MVPDRKEKKENTKLGRGDMAPPRSKEEGKREVAAARLPPAEHGAGCWMCHRWTSGRQVEAPQRVLGSSTLGPASHGLHAGLHHVSPPACGARLLSPGGFQSWVFGGLIPQVQVLKVAGA